MQTRFEFDGGHATAICRRNLVQCHLRSKSLVGQHHRQPVERHLVTDSFLRVANRVVRKTAAQRPSGVILTVYVCACQAVSFVITPDIYFIGARAMRTTARCDDATRARTGTGRS